MSNNHVRDTCRICSKAFANNKGGQLTNHVKIEHNLELEEYIVLIEYQGLEPKCRCGFCEERPLFRRGHYSHYALGHNSIEWGKQKYIELYGPPQCYQCQKIIGFERGVPNKYCSFICSGKNTGFSKIETQKKIRETIKTKYGVDNIAQLQETKDKISKALLGKPRRQLYTSEQRKAISTNSKNMWAFFTDEQRGNIGIKISKGILSNPLEIQRRSSYALKNLKSLTKGRFSKLHQRINKILDLEGLGFIKEQRIGNFIVDELHKNAKLIIEINGNWVHANPKYYKASDLITIRSNQYLAEERWAKDDKKISYLKSLGYQVVIIWEDDDYIEKKKEIEKHLHNQIRTQ